jgi:hypothetical protein
MNDTYQHADGVPRKIEPLNTIPTSTWVAEDTEDLEAALDEAQEQAYELSQDVLIAAANGDKAGAEALLHVLAIRLGDIIEIIRRRDAHTA